MKLFTAAVNENPQRRTFTFAKVLKKERKKKSGYCLTFDAVNQWFQNVTQPVKAKAAHSKTEAVQNLDILVYFCCGDDIV